MSASAVELVGGGPVAVANIACFARTYREHAAELGNPVPSEPLLFLKSTRALRGLDGGPLAFPDEAFHHEAELVVLVGREVPFGGRASWADVRAVGLGLDLTRRGVQTTLKSKGHPWTTAKSFAGSAIVSPLTPTEALTDRDAIAFELSVEGELRQRGSTAELTYDVPAQLSYLASLHGVGPGDLVFTGTPAGVGEIRRGERFVLASPELGRYAGRL